MIPIKSKHLSKIFYRCTSHFRVAAVNSIRAGSKTFHPIVLNVGVVWPVLCT